MKNGHGTSIRFQMYRCRAAQSAVLVRKPLVMFESGRAHRRHVFVMRWQDAPCPMPRATILSPDQQPPAFPIPPSRIPRLRCLRCVASSHMHTMQAALLHHTGPRPKQTPGHAHRKGRADHELLEPAPRPTGVLAILSQSMPKYGSSETAPWKKSTSVMTSITTRPVASRMASAYGGSSVHSSRTARIMGCSASLAWTSATQCGCT
mmetsp:Transcript_51188/g.141672  ORF Transcript_51188/g.141672 Transcript_51188/m.141672 type:complete len:206 (+) Transcript_51188:126-743(+)